MKKIMVDKDSTVYGYRWVLCVLLGLMQVAVFFVWIAPSPVLGSIMKEMNLDSGLAGSFVTAIPLMMGICVFFGTFVADRLGCRITMSLGMGLLGVGALLSLWANSYIFMFIARLISGLGFAFSIPFMSSVVLAWFPPKEQPGVNGVINSLSFAGMALTYLITIPITNAMMGSWRGTMAIYGGFGILIALLWAIFGRSAPPNVAAQSVQEIKTEPVKKEGGLKQAAKRKEIWLLTGAFIPVQWAFNTFTTYLPLYFQDAYKMDAASAGAITGILPIIGIFGTLIGGFGAGWLGLRKPFIWASLFSILVGGIGSVYAAPGFLLYVCVGLIGLGIAMFVPSIYQVPMDLKGMTPAGAGGSVAIMLGVSYIISYFVAPVFGWVSPALGMGTTMVVFGCTLAISLVFCSVLPETGPNTKKNRRGKELSKA